MVNTMETKQKYIYLGLGVVILAIYGVILLVIFFGKSNSGLLQTSTSPTPIPSPTPLGAQTKPPLSYDQKSVDRLSQLLKERTAISPSGSAIRASLAQSLGSKSGVLQKTSEYTLRYIQAADVFQAEITTINIAQAKLLATAYLKAKGLSQDGICHLPLVFYLSKKTAVALSGKALTFSPIPEGC